MTVMDRNNVCFVVNEHGRILSVRTGLCAAYNDAVTFPAAKAIELWNGVKGTLIEIRDIHG